MVPMRHSTIFKSRWMALLWSAGVLWFAIDVADSNDDGGSANAANASSPNDTTSERALDETRKLVDQLNAK